MCGWNETRNLISPRTQLYINCSKAEAAESSGSADKKADVLYMVGRAGYEGCPQGFTRIMDEETCEIASEFLKLKYDHKGMNYKGRDVFVCKTWGGGRSQRTIMSNKHGRALPPQAISKAGQPPCAISKRRGPRTVALRSSP